MEILFYFFMTLVFSTLFSMGGVGSAIALVSIFPMLGMPLNMAKAVGLFINASSTISASLVNIYRKKLDINFAVPLVISILIGTPVGAYLSQYVAQYWVKWILIVFLLISASLLLKSNLLKQRNQARFNYTHTWILYVIGLSIGLISGLLGVGGGSLLIPLLILLGFEAKKAAYTVSFVIPFSSLGGFFTYLHFVEMDWILLAVVTVAAFIGGFIGNRIMYYYLSEHQVKKIIAIVLYLLAIKLLMGQF